MKKFVYLIAGLLLLSLLTASFVSGFAVGNLFADNTKERTDTRVSPHQSPPVNTAEIATVKEVFDRLNRDYVEKVNRKKLIDGAVDGMIKALKDPYTRRLKKTDYKTFQEQTVGHFGGVGIELGMRDEKLTVIAPIKNTPADRAGVQAGDKIDKIDGRSTKGMSLEKAVKLIRGKEGTKVTLTLIRDGEKPIDAELVRSEIKMPNVSGRVIDNDIGYVKLHAFNSDTAADVKKELADVKSDGAKGVIVDLRNNPGGLLNEAVQVSSIFIRSGPIVKVKARNNKTETFSAFNGADEKTPLVVMVNRGSASASEIFAGAVQDTGRGLIVGERTFGKASVQTIVELGDGTGLVLTTATYFTPNGRSINKQGVKPDAIVKFKKEEWHKMSTDQDPQLNKAKELLRDLMVNEKVKNAS